MDLLERLQAKIPGAPLVQIALAELKKTDEIQTFYKEYVAFYQRQDRDITPEFAALQDIRDEIINYAPETTLLWNTAIPELRAAPANESTRLRVSEMQTPLGKRTVGTRRR